MIVWAMHNILGEKRSDSMSMIVLYVSRVGVDDSHV